MEQLKNESETELQNQSEAEMRDEKYMKEAIKQAKKAYAIGEVPIGCVIVYQDKIIGRGYNRRTIDNNTLAHAELAEIRKASRKMFFKSENREIWKTKNGVFLNGTLRCVSLIIYHLKNDFKRKFISVTIVKEEN